MEITVVKALYDYAGDKPGRLHFSAGDSVQVLHQQPSGWWDGIAHGKRGWFPSNYVTLPPSRTRIRLPDTYYGWERRERRDGGVFFHNPLTGESVKEIPASPTLSTRSNSTTAEVDIPPTIPESLQASTSTPTRRRSSVSGPGWEMLRQQILNAINDLKLAQKDEYLVMSSRIVQSIHQMLAASNALEKDAMILKSNKMLKIHHRHVLKSLSQLVLTSKQAAGMFAPEDAVNKMHADANEVWLAVRHFTSIAEDTGIPLRVSDFTSSMSNQISIGHQSASSSKQQPQPTHQQASSDAVFEELTKTLDSTCNEIFGGLRRLRDVVYLKPLPAATLIEQTKDAVLQIGQFLSLLDEIDEESIHLVSSPYSPSPLVEPDQTAKFFQDFIGSKENLYQSIRQLVTSTTSATDSSIQSANIITSLDESVNFVHQTVTALVESIRPLLEIWERKETRRFVRGHSTKPSLSSVGSISPPPPIVDLTRTDSDISVEPRRALSMNIMNPEAQSQVKTTPPASMDRNQVFASAPTSPAVDRQSIIQSSMRRSTSMFGSPKLSKFFGEEIREEHMGGGQERRGRDQRPWYLGYESDPKDVLLTMEGNVKGATLPALIERITLHDEFDSNLMHSFLLTYRTFAKGVEVFRLLQERFMLEPPAQLTPDELTAWSEGKLKPIRLRVINVFKSWLDAYFFSREDRGVLSMMREFVQNTVKEVMPAAAEQLIKLIEKRETMRNRMSIKRQTLVSPGAIPKGDPPAPILPKTFEKFRLIDIDPLEMARQLTILDSSLYDRIEDIEFVDKAWSNKENTKAAPNIRMMIRLSNQVTGWVAETILSEYDVKRRSSLMKYFIYVADRCRHLNNYNMLMAILAALNSSPIHRLKRTFDLLSNKTCVLLEELKVLMAPTHNFTNYRNKLRSASLPCVPFLGLYLTDLTFIEDGNLNHIKSLPHLINIDKRLKTAEKIREIRQYRSVPFNLIEVPEMQMFLAANLENSTTDTDALYEQSLILEPRESEDERIVRLLHETGFA